MVKRFTFHPQFNKKEWYPTPCQAEPDTSCFNMSTAVVGSFLGNQKHLVHCKAIQSTVIVSTSGALQQACKKRLDILDLSCHRHLLLFCHYFRCWWLDNTYPLYSQHRNLPFCTNFPPPNFHLLLRSSTHSCYFSRKRATCRHLAALQLQFCHLVLA